jgi:hypothetical protein
MAHAFGSTYLAAIPMFEVGDLNNREIGAKVGVTEERIRKLRKRWEATGATPRRIVPAAADASAAHMPKPAEGPNGLEPSALKGDVTTAASGWPSEDRLTTSEKKAIAIGARALTSVHQRPGTRVGGALRKVMAADPYESARIEAEVEELRNAPSPAREVTTYERTDTYPR